MYLHPFVSTTPWTAQEDDILMTEYRTLGAKWAAIALFLPGRTEVHVKNRWSKLDRDRAKSRAATAKEARAESARKGPKQGRLQFAPISELCPGSGLWAGLGRPTFNWADMLSQADSTKADDSMTVSDTA
jgi:hypothetical protein